MDGWFTVETIDDETFAISEYKHWEEVHSYLLIGRERAVLIDRGLGVSNIKNVVANLTELPVLVVTTHVHWDHIGGHGLFDDVAVFETEKDWLAGKFPIPLEVVKSNLTKLPCDFPEYFDPKNYRICQREPTRILHDSERIDLGDRYITVVHTPGHSPGHCCFYEPERQYLFSGDLIYEGCLDAFYPSTDPVAFMHSIERVKQLCIKKILPAHHRIDIPAGLTDKIYDAFTYLYDNNKLVQGNGIFDFGSFKIHI